ncbi:Aminoacylase-1 [Taenia crassiceps]
MGTRGHGGVDIPIDSHPHDVWWSILEAVLSARSVGLQTGISGGANDDRYLRQYHRLYAPNSKPIKAISFSPLRNTPILHHASDEFVNRKAFLEGVEILTEVVRAMASVECEEEGEEGDNDDDDGDGDVEGEGEGEVGEADDGDGA